MKKVWVPNPVAMEELVLLINQPVYGATPTIEILKNTYKNIGTITPVRVTEGIYTLTTTNDIQTNALFGTGKRENQQIIITQTGPKELTIISYNTFGDFYEDVLVNVPLYIQFHNAKYI